MDDRQHKNVILVRFFFVCIFLDKKNAAVLLYNKSEFLGNAYFQIQMVGNNFKFFNVIHISEKITIKIRIKNKENDHYF